MLTLRLWGAPGSVAILDRVDMTATKIETAADRSGRYVLAEGAPLVKNLGALWATDPEVAAEVEEELMRGVYEVEQSKSGAATLALEAEGRKIYLHSRHQPVDEARRL